jgi:hypothetical protein
MTLYSNSVWAKGNSNLPLKSIDNHQQMLPCFTQVFKDIQIILNMSILCFGAF